MAGKIAAAALAALCLAAATSFTRRPAREAAPRISATYLAYLCNTCEGNVDEAERCAEMYPQLRAVFMEAVR